MSLLNLIVLVIEFFCTILFKLKLLMNRTLLVLVLLTIFVSCGENARTVTLKNKVKETVRKVLPPPKPNIDAELITWIDLPVENVAPSTESRSERLKNSYVVPRIEKMMGETMQYWTEKAGLSYPPQCVVFRNFKLEGEFEIWGGNNDKELKLIKTFEVCAADFEPGPKLQQGDYKTPEGFYELRTLLDSKISWMWINLEDDEFLDDIGQVGVGSSYKLFMPYPNVYDRKRTRDNLGNGTSTGGEICIHGNCASAGCISFRNNLYSAVYLFAQHHNNRRYGNPKIHSFPFRFKENYKDYYAPKAKDMNAERAMSFWANLEKGYDTFNEQPRNIKWRVSEKGYQFY